jgi:hypothetical protein
MRFSEVQKAIAARILACPELARFGEPLVLDLYAEPDTLRDTTAAAVRRHGVALEIDWPFAGSRPDTTSAGTTHGSVECTVYINESPVVEHQPARQELIEIVMGAIAAPLQRGEKEISVAYMESAKDDKGIITHAIDCTVVARFGKAGRA